MKCFYHHDHDAVGSCKSCGKGLCMDCAVDMGKGLACKSRCEDDVKTLIDLIDRNIALSPTGTRVIVLARRNAFMQSAFLLVAGLIFLLAGLASEHLLNVAFLLGVAFLVFGVITVSRAKSLPKVRLEGGNPTPARASPSICGEANVRSGR